MFYFTHIGLWTVTHIVVVSRLTQLDVVLGLIMLVTQFIQGQQTIIYFKQRKHKFQPLKRNKNTYLIICFFFVYSTNSLQLSILMLQYFFHGEVFSRDSGIFYTTFLSFYVLYGLFVTSYAVPSWLACPRGTRSRSECSSRLAE